MTSVTAAHARATYPPILARLSQPKAHITGRQIEAIRHAANGNTNDAIGRAMGISGNSVQQLLRKAYLKLGVSDRAQAVAVAIRLELIRLDDIRLPEAVSARLTPAAAAPAPTPQLAPAGPPQARTAPKETQP